MKRLLIVTMLGALLSGTAGCRFFDCLFRGGPANQTCQPAATVVCPPPCVSSCAPADGCSPCSSPAATVTPGPATYAPTGNR